MNADEIKGYLSEDLINHFDEFNTERFYVDEAREDHVSIATTSISDPCPINLCRNIAEHIKGFYEKYGYDCPQYVYVGAWGFPSYKL